MRQKFQTSNNIYRDNLHVDPSIGSKFGSLVHRKCLMVHTAVLFQWRVVENRRPQNSSSTFWLDRDAKLWKVCSTTFFNVTQVKKECENPWSAFSILLMLDIIMVRPVESENNSK